MSLILTCIKVYWIQLMLPSLLAVANRSLVVFNEQLKDKLKIYNNWLLYANYSKFYPLLL
jgi:hypothetical protein